MAAADGQREKKIAIDIKEEFCKRVIPSDLIPHLQCLTKDDIERVLEDEEKHGPMYAADVLLQRLVQQSGWLSHLKAALLNPDAGLLDFGERIELMCSIQVGGRIGGRNGGIGNRLEEFNTIITDEASVMHPPQNPPPSPPPPNPPI